VNASKMIKRIMIVPVIQWMHNWSDLGLISTAEVSTDHVICGWGYQKWTKIISLIGDHSTQVQTVCTVMDQDHDPLSDLGTALNHAHQLYSSDCDHSLCL